MATKRLARQLGVVRSSSGTAAGGERPRPRQLFGYLIVIDFESTCWSDGQKRGQEIIEFPAVLLNASDGEIESEFHTYVQPQEHPILSEFCTELTGIKQNQVDEGVPLHICLSQFSKWIQKIQKEKKIVFHSTPASCSAVKGKLCTFVTWSDWDLGVCLHYECKRKQLRKPDMLNSWIDLRATYKVFYSRKPRGLTGALQDVGISFAGREHCGLDDSRNTARLAWRMICDGCMMKITKSLDKAPPAPKSIARFLSVKPVDRSPLGSYDGAKAACLDEDRHSEVAARPENVNGEHTQELTSVHLCGNIHVAPRNCKKAGARGSVQSRWTPDTGSFNIPLGCLQPSYSNSFVDFQSRLNKEHLTSNSSTCNTSLVLVSTTLSSVNVSDTEISTTSDCLSMLADWEDVALIPDSQYNQSSEFLLLNKDQDNMSLLTFGDTEDGNESHVNLGSEKVGKTSRKIELSNKTVLGKNPTITVYDNATVPSKFTNPFAFRVSASKAMVPSVGTLKENCVTLSSGTHKRKPSSPKSFLPAKKPPVYEDKEVASKSSLTFRSLGSYLMPSGALHSSVNVGQSAENQRLTPPLCLCGRRARKLNVSNGGPNHGRAFYSCPVGKWEGHRKGCGYFKWEHALFKEKCAFSSLPSAVGLQFQRTSVSSSGRPQQTFLHLRPSMRT